MAKPLAVGDEAPNFDLTSTEGVVLMLRDEVGRNAQILCFFGDPAGERARSDLLALARARADLARLRAGVLGISPAKLDDLRAAQRDLKLPFPLLRDDRGFSAHYGIEPPGDDGEGESALVVVDREQRVIWIASPSGPAQEALAPIRQVLKRSPSPTSNYPRSIVNRLVDRWVN